MDSGFRIHGFRIHFGFRIQDSVWIHKNTKLDSGFRIQDSEKTPRGGFRIQDSGFRIDWFGFRRVFSNTGAVGVFWSYQRAVSDLFGRPRWPGVPCMADITAILDGS